jgi:hypothetical protein
MVLLWVITGILLQHGLQGTQVSPDNTVLELLAPQARLSAMLVVYKGS